MIREVVTIDEELCDGCGLCVPSCAEGALQIVDGKAKLISDKYCDGLGACLGHCPQDAIKIERREAVAFDEAAVEAHLAASASTPEPKPAPVCPSARMQQFESQSHNGPPSGGCPGARLAQFAGSAEPGNDAVQSPAASPSALMHWPVKLRLLPPEAPVLREAALLVAADCVPFAQADFHTRMLRGRAVVIGCPKFDDLAAYVEKLAAMIRVNNLREIVVARMEVPCCMGIVHAVVEARRQAGVDVPVREVVVGLRGDVVAENEIPAAIQQ